VEDTGRDIHMGNLLEATVRRNSLNITKLAKVIGVSRRTLYLWFNQQELQPDVLQQISKGLHCNFNVALENKIDLTTSTSVVATDPELNQSEQYWQDKYIDLLERYSSLLLKTKDSQKPG
jgi:plasmid maintenance system antidote protein VapI